MAEAVKKAAPKKAKATKKTTTLAKPKAKAAAAAGDNSNSNLPSAKVVKEHLSSVKEEQSKLARIRGNIGAMVKAAEADYNIDRRAMAFVVKCAKMEEQDRDGFLRQIRHLLLVCDLGVQGDLVNDIDAKQAV